MTEKHARPEMMCAHCLQVRPHGGRHLCGSCHTILGLAGTRDQYPQLHTHLPRVWRMQQYAQLRTRRPRPTKAELARLLGVSVRTIDRYSAALRAQTFAQKAAA